MFPAYLRDDGLGAEPTDGTPRRPNLSPAAHSYLERLGMDVEDLFHHVLAVLHDPAYREANAGALRMEWPRIPLPGWPDGNDDGAAAELAESAARGRKLAALLDPDTPVPGITETPLHPGIEEIAVPSTTDNTNMTGDDFALTAGWGHLGQGEAVMPGQGRVVERPYTTPEQTALNTIMPGTPATERSSATPRSVVPAEAGTQRGGGEGAPRPASSEQSPRGTFGLSLSKACPEPAEGASAHQHNDEMDQSPEDTFGLSLSKASAQPAEGASAYQHNDDMDQSPEDTFGRACRACR